MTRTDVMASSRPRRPGTAARGASARLRLGLLLLPILLLMSLALATPGVAVASTESTYGSEPNKPKEGTSPSKESSPPSKEEPASPAAAPSSEKASTASTASTSTLPFTGFDLRWSIAAGLLLMGAGLSIVVVQRRHGRQQR